jgi:hypothetical protein
MKTWTKRIVILLETCSWVYSSFFFVSIRTCMWIADMGRDVETGPTDHSLSLVLGILEPRSNYFFFFQECMYDVKCVQCQQKIQGAYTWIYLMMMMMFSTESPSLLPSFSFYEEEELNIFRVIFHCIRSIFFESYQFLVALVVDNVPPVRYPELITKNTYMGQLLRTKD